MVNCVEKEKQAQLLKGADCVRLKLVQKMVGNGNSVELIAAWLEISIEAVRDSIKMLSK